MEKQKNMKKRDLHEALRIQAKIDVFIKKNKQKQKKHQKIRYQKTSKIKVLGSFWKGKSHPKWRLFQNMKNMKKAWQAQQI